MLKFLEEPPSETLFLLISHAPDGLLPTIRSRCRTLDLTPLAPDALDQALTAADAEMPKGGNVILAELAAGSAGQALRMIEGDGLAIYDKLVAMLRSGRGVDRQALIQLAELCAGRDTAPAVMPWFCPCPS